MRGGRFRKLWLEKAILGFCVHEDGLESDGDAGYNYNIAIAGDPEKLFWA